MRGTILNNRTLRLVVSCLVIFTLIFMGLEKAARSSMARENLIAPSLGMNSMLFEVKIDAVDRLVAEHGEIDCLILGSSMAHRGINVELMTHVYQERTGESIVCYNFGYTGLTARVAGEMGEFLVERYHPKVMIYETSSRAYFDRELQAMDVAIVQSDWINYSLGDFNLHGWLVEQSYAYRYLLRYRNWSSQNYDHILNTAEAQMVDARPYGFEPRIEVDFDIHIPALESDMGEDKSLLAYHAAEGFPSTEDLAGFERIVKLNQTTATQVIILEMPVHASYVQLFPYHEQGWADFITALRDLTNEYGVPLWVTNDKLTIPDEFWSDRAHLMGNGANLLSYWLGEQLALAVPHGLWEGNLPAGDVPDPTLPLPAIDATALTANPYGFNNEQAIRFAESMAELDEIGIIPSDARLFNPNFPSENTHHHAYNIALYLQYFEEPLSNERWQVSVETMRLLEMMAGRTNLGLTPAQYEVLDAWYVDFAPEHLQAVGLEYVMVSTFWLRTQPSSLAEKQLNNAERYEFLGEWSHPAVATTYRLYRVITHPQIFG